MTCLRFLEEGGVFGRPALGEPLGARQVDEVQAALARHVSGGVLAVDAQREQAVAARAVGVDARGLGAAAAHGAGQQRAHLARRGHVHLQGARDNRFGDC